MGECIFCKIASGSIGASKVYEDDECMAFLDINPAFKGHVLIIPKDHIETLIGLSPERAGHLMKVTQRVAKALLKSRRCDGFNVLMNNRRAAGQEIDHAHMHVIPRFEDDNFSLGWPHTGYEEGEAEKIAQDIKRYITQ